MRIARLHPHSSLQPTADALVLALDATHPHSEENSIFGALHLSAACMLLRDNSLTDQFHLSTLAVLRIQWIVFELLRCREGLNDHVYENVGRRASQSHWVSLSLSASLATDNLYRHEPHSARRSRTHRLNRSDISAWLSRVASASLLERRARAKIACRGPSKKGRLHMHFLLAAGTSRIADRIRCRPIRACPSLYP